MLRVVFRRRFQAPAEQSFTSNGLLQRAFSHTASVRKPGTKRYTSLANGARDHPWRQWQRLEQFFATGQVCVIDGANGTEIQRRCGRPAETFSSGTEALTRPDLCQEVHEAYLEAGCDVIITHSYGANGNVMKASGNGGRVQEAIISAAALARRAALNHVSHHASNVLHAASNITSAASLSAKAASRSAARASTSHQTNANALSSAQAALDNTKLAVESVQTALQTIQELHASAVAANAAASAAIAASEGEPLPEAMPPVVPPDPVRTQGWDSAGFGPPLIVGSMSTHPPEMRAGGASSADASWPEPDVEEANYRDAAEAHGFSGVDMLFMEMMKDDEHAPRAVRAATRSGLPVFLGISARLDPVTGKAVLFGTGVDAKPLKQEWFRNLADILGDNLVGVNVMHTDFSCMSEGLRFIREDCGWRGPLGAYPDHGTFQAPEWIFAELDNNTALAHIDEWISRFNVQLIGGCCGLGPEYITAVSTAMRHHNAGVRRRNAKLSKPKLAPFNF